MSLLVAAARAVALWQIGVHAKQGWDRKAAYRLAEEYARSVGKPLMVVGGPWGGNWLRAWLRIPSHGFGDVCVDQNPAACEGCPNCQIITADIRAIPLPDKSMGAAFASHILEHMPTAEDAAQAWQELHRVAEKVYACYPSRFSLSGWLGRDHHLWVDVAGDTLYIEERNSGRRVVAGTYRLA